MIIVQALVGLPPRPSSLDDPVPLHYNLVELGAPVACSQVSKLETIQALPTSLVCVHVMKLEHGNLFCTYHGGDDSIKKKIS